MSELSQMARTWLLTPFMIGASVKGQGCDCAGLLEGVFRELGHVVPSRRATNLCEALESVDYLTPSDCFQIGDILLFSQICGASEPENFHAGILVENNYLIHSHWTRGVTINRFGNWFQTRLRKSYRYTGTPNWQL
jgi:cell wall-associated NlpC family hydrolase